MNGEHLDGPKRAERATGNERSHKESRKRREGARPPGHRSGHENAAEAGQAANGDKILRTERGGGNGRRAVDDSAQIHGQELPTKAGGGERAVGSNGEPATPSSTDKGYRGWVPSGVLLALGEVLVAVLVAEIGWVVAMLVLTLIERLAELPEPVARHGFVSALLFGLVCGLYVLIRLRSRRLAWRKHLRGER